VDDLTLEAVVLRELSLRAAACTLPFLVVGASARDIAIRSAGISMQLRRTSDVDIAVAVADWADLDRLTAGLPRKGNAMHTFLVHGVPVDIVPFRGVETPERTIRWPDDHEMNVAGMEEAMSSAALVDLADDVRVHVATLPAQVVLKLFAWGDRHHQTTRDAIDLRAILDAYSSGSHLDALYDDFEDALDRHDFDVLVATAARVGQEAAEMLPDATVAALLSLLAAEQAEPGTLAAQMGFDVARNRALLAALSQGLQADR